ncbi:MAG: iron ABC transporter permease [Candidatus Cohnella colombiensis]|uniref:Iron ABC transporter permease n=1 Tax=Candidatus Cohnella colombiensis TaxID=3121368 RepID=A0AA95J960_9BACL|nr:MAG: iron ABC transporter permease [Cohnella sp.]
MTLTYPEATTEHAELRSRPITAILTIVIGLGVLVFSLAIAIALGYKDIKLDEVWAALFHYNSEFTNHLVIWELRLPRVLGAALIGAAFAVSGAIMQGISRNPLADAGLLGLNSGAAFTLVICLSIFPALPYHYILIVCFVGAGIGALLVFGIGSMTRGGLTPIRLILAGAAVSAMLAALGDGIALYFRVGQRVAFWFAGGLSGVKWDQLDLIVPWFACAIAGALMLSRSITTLSLGEDTARGLGQRVGLTKILSLLIVLILAGASFSIVGAVSFIGLIAPHVTRYIVGVDYRWIIPCSAIIGAIFVVWADLVGRIVHPPYETPVGAIICLIGVPFFLYLARKERRKL